MFAIELVMFSIGTIVVPTHIEFVLKPVCIPNIIMVEPILKQHVIPIDVLAMKLCIPSDIVKQHLAKIVFHPEVREMIVSEPLAQE
jgi:hypothetical protein